MSKSLQDCFAESLTQEVGLDEEITEQFIQQIGQVGELQYFPNFSRPFFKLTVTGRYSITGIQGNTSLRIVLCHDNKSENIRHLIQLIESYSA